MLINIKIVIITVVNNNNNLTYSIHTHIQKSITSKHVVLIHNNTVNYIFVLVTYIQVACP